jgi:O-antigen/teichoic acid export membrane protein
MNFKGMSIVDFVSAIAGSLITLMLALNGFGVWSLVWGSMAITVSRTIGLNVISPYLHIPIFSFKGMAQTITFGGYVTISRILRGFYTQADTFVIGKLLGKELLGFYSVGMTLATLPMEKVSGIINQVAFPAFSRIQNDSQEASSHFLKAVRVMSFLAFPVLWGMSSIAPELVAVLLGDKWKLAVVPFQLLSLVIPIRMISNLMAPAVMGLGRPDISFYNTLLAFVVMPLVILIFTHWGLTAVCLAWVIFFPLVFWRNLSRVVPLLGTRVSDVVKAMIKPVLAGASMYIIVMALKMVFGNDQKSIGHLLLLIITGALVYGGLIVSVYREGCREVLGLLIR